MSVFEVKAQLNDARIQYSEGVVAEQIAQRAFDAALFPLDECSFAAAEANRTIGDAIDNLQAAMCGLRRVVELADRGRAASYVIKNNGDEAAGQAIRAGECARDGQDALRQAVGAREADIVGEEARYKSSDSVLDARALGLQGEQLAANFSTGLDGTRDAIDLLQQVQELAAPLSEAFLSTGDDQERFVQRGRASTEEAIQGFRDTVGYIERLDGSL